MKVKSEREVAQSYPTLGDPMDCSLPGSSVHRIFQATVLEWVTIAFGTTIKNLRDWDHKKPQRGATPKEGAGNTLAVSMASDVLAVNLGETQSHIMLYTLYIFIL